MEGFRLGERPSSLPALVDEEHAAFQPHYGGFVQIDRQKAAQCGPALSDALCLRCHCER